MLGVLGPPTDEGAIEDVALEPQPGSVRHRHPRRRGRGQSGLDITWSSSPTTSCRTSRRGRALAYRIVQEALTNARKHAGPASVTVTIRSETPIALAITVDDDGRGSRRWWVSARASVSSACASARASWAAS
jgi:signal transduction histidine kinase